MAGVVNANDPAGHIDELPILKSSDLDLDPHGVFRRYRAEYRFIRRESGGYLALRHADIERLDKDPRTIAGGTAFPEMLGVKDGRLFDFFEQGMLTANGLVHRRRRAPFSRSFAARTIADLRPRLRRTSEELIDSWYSDGHVEFVTNFACQLTARTIGDLLGLPQADIPFVTMLVSELTRFVSHSITPDGIPKSAEACQQLYDYVKKTLDERRRAPRDDFVSRFVEIAKAAGEMSPFEMIFQIMQLIIGGTDTTRVAIVVQVALLLQYREQWEAVCRNSALIPSAVAEAMRFEPSVGSIVRVTTEDIEIGGAILPAGQLVVLSTMSAARDEEVYERPDVFDIHRTDHPRLHPIFGAGAHRCIGEALARAQLEESLAALSTRIPQLQLDQAPAIRGHAGIRRVDTMHISWRP